MKLMITILTGAAFASAAQAKTANIVVQGEPVARVVSYADLNLGSDAGRATLAGRIRSAADFVCADANVDPLDVRLARIKCNRVAVANGTERMNARIGR